MADTIDPKIKAFTLAIRDAETGGNYTAKGASGESGGYQFMPGRFSELAKKYLGDEKAPMTPENQNKVTYSYVKEKKDQGYQPPQIASMWNAGEGRPNAYKENWRGVNSQGVAYDTPAYVSKVETAYKKYAPTAEASTVIPETLETTLGVNQQKDIETAQRYGAAFTPNTQNPTLLGEAAKTVGNVLPSAWNLAKGIVDIMNPVSTAKKIGEIATDFGELKNESYGSGGLAFNKIVQELPGTAYESLVPEAGRALVSAGAGALTGDQQKVTQNLEQAQRAITSDPVGQIAPFLVAGRAVAGKMGAGGAFDSAISKVAKPIVKPVESAISGTKNMASKTARFGTAQATGLQPETISEIINNPKAYTKASQATVDRISIGKEVQSSLGKRAATLKETGTAYDPIRKLTTEVKVKPTWLEDKIVKETGIAIKKGKMTATGSAKIRNAADVRAVQHLYDMWQPFFKKGKMTTNEYLNFRTDLADLARFERQIGKSKPIEAFTGRLRAQFNKANRSQIKGLKALDDDFSTQYTQLKELSKGIVDKNGNLTDAAINRIANATGKGKDNLIARLEQTVPGITQKIKTLKAVEDIQHASGIKVGTYGRAALGVGVGVGAGVIPGIITAILTSPELAVPILRRYGVLKNAAVVQAVVNALKSGATNVNQLPNKGIPEALKKDVKDVNLPVGMSIKDVSGGKPSAFSPKGKDEIPSTKIPKYLKGTAEEMANFRGKKAGIIDDETYLYIDDWKNIDAGNIKKNMATKPPSENVINRLSEFKPTEPITLYRGVRDNQVMGSKTGYESWSKSKRAAGGFGKVESRVFTPDEVLVDFQKLPKWMEDINRNVEREVIVKSGKSSTQNLYHGTNDISWIQKGETIKKSESSTMGNPGVFFTKDIQSAGDWVPASGGAFQAQTRGAKGGVVQLSKKGADKFNLKKMSSGKYEELWFKTMKELRDNPEKFGKDKYEVHELSGWEIVENRLKEKGYDGVDFGDSGVLFDPKQVESKIVAELEKNKGAGYTIKNKTNFGT